MRYFFRLKVQIAEKGDRLAFVINGKKKYIIDRTMIGNISDSKIEDKGEIIEMFLMLRQIGADFIEVDNNIITMLYNLLPQNINYIYRIKKAEDYITYKAGCFSYGVLEYNLFLKLWENEKSNMNPQKLIVEIDYKDIKNEGRLFKLKESIKLKDIHGIRIKDMYENLFLEEDNIISRIKQHLGCDISIDICADDRCYMATSVALEAALNGADSITTALLGIGGSNGLAATEEVLLAIKFVLKLGINGDTSILKSLSELYEKLTNNVIDGMKPVVGRDIFKYESGVHADGIEKNPATYEPYNPNIVGLERTLVIGKHSGSKAVKKKLNSLGLQYDNEDIIKILKLVRERSIELGRGLKNEELIEMCKRMKN